MVIHTVTKEELADLFIFKEKKVKLTGVLKLKSYKKIIDFKEKKETLLLINVKFNDFIIDHIWLEHDYLNFEENDILEVYGKINTYNKNIFVKSISFSKIYHIEKHEKI